MLEGVQDKVLEQLLVGHAHLYRHTCWAVLSVPASDQITDYTSDVQVLHDGKVYESFKGDLPKLTLCFAGKKGDSQGDSFAGEKGDSFAGKKGDSQQDSFAGKNGDSFAGKKGDSLQERHSFAGKKGDSQGASFVGKKGDSFAGKKGDSFAGKKGDSQGDNFAQKKGVCYAAKKGDRTIFSVARAIWSMTEITKP